jgi:hypothetical protein
LTTQSDTPSAKRSKSNLNLSSEYTKIKTEDDNNIKVEKAEVMDNNGKDSSDDDLDDL